MACLDSGSELDSNLMTRCVQLTVYDGQCSNGELRSVNVIHLNTNFKFHGVWVDATYITGFTHDENYLVVSTNLSMIVRAFKYFDSRTLKILCNAHLIGHKQSSKLVLLDIMTIHTCTPTCSHYVYVFKCLERSWLNVLEKFVVFRLSLGSEKSIRANQQQRATQQQHQSHSVGTFENAGPVESSDNADIHGDDPTTTGHLDVVGDERKLDMIREWQEEMSTHALAPVTCAVCSVRTSRTKSDIVHANTVNLDVLRNDDLPEYVLPTSYDLRVYRHALLNPNGLEFRDRLGTMRICHTCLSSLSKSVMPKFALSNWLYYGREYLPEPVKTAFKDSSIFERMLICRARSNSVTCRFNAHGNGSTTQDAMDGQHQTSEENLLARARRGIRGNIIVTPLDTMKMNDIIPPPSSFIRDTMSAIFIGKGIPTRTNIKKYSPVLVRRSRVKTMIEFLLQFNPHYGASEKFRYSPSNLNAVVDGNDLEDSIPSAVYIGHLSQNEAVEGATSDYTDRNIIHDEGDEEDGDLLMENVGYTEGDHSPLSYQRMKNVALARCLAGRPFIGSGTGSDIIPDFQNPSLLTWLFPHLDPWGIGGFHHPKRKQSISLIEQLRHILSIDDREFESDPEFAFSFYNVYRKTLVSQSLRFSVPARTHVSILSNLRRLDPEVLRKLNATCEKDPYYKAVDPEEINAFKCLSTVRMVSKHVPGSDGYKTMRRNEIRGLMNYKGAPILFVTINPSDVDNPIVRLLAGDDICLEDVHRGEDLNKWRRSVFAAKNPSACARFFDLVITNFIKVILRYGREEPGLYGKCTSYYGTVEAQGKGTLHCHMLLWLEGHLSPQRLRDQMLECGDYKNKFFRWLESIIKCEFPNSTGIESQRKLHSKQKLHNENGDPHPGVIAPPLAKNFSIPAEFWAEYDRFVETLIYHYGWHVHTATCWKYLERGQEKNDTNCRVGMNGKLYETSEMDRDTLEIILRRHHPSIAAHTDLVIFLLRCNMDIKHVGTGDAANAFVYYVTDYITKSSLSVHVGMAVLLHALDKLKYVPSCGVDQAPDNAQALRAVTVAVNSMMGRQEISHPQVMSYLVGGGDHYTSDKFALLLWGSIRSECGAILSNEDMSMDGQPGANGSISLVLEEKGMTVSSQHLDYTLRSTDESFNKLCLYDFAALTSKVRYPKSLPDNTRRKGSFIDERHPQYATHHLVIGREYKIPVLLGPRIPNPARSPESKEEWSKDMLLLFKAWRDISELRSHGQSWTEAYSEYEPYMSSKHMKITQNMLVTTECAEARDRHRDKRKGKMVDDAMIDNGLDDVFCDIVNRKGWSDDQETCDPFEEFDPERNHDVSHIDKFRAVVDEETYVMMDVCYPTIDTTTAGVPAVPPEKIGEEQDVVMEKHHVIMTEKKKRKCLAGADDPDNSKRIRLDVKPTVKWMTLAEDTSQIDKSIKYDVLNAVAGDMGLEDNEEQLRAFQIIAEHTIEAKPDQLMMHVSGVGGTGKSHLIKAIIMLFERLGIRHKLILGAPTGIAAVLIKGQTLHSLILASPNGKSNDMSTLYEIWRHAGLLLIDEVSMIGARFMSDMCSRVRLARGDNIVDREKPFGGLNVVFMGDFGQLKPPKQAALYSSNLVKHPSFPESRDNRGVNAMNGAFIWRQVKTVVELVKNQRHSEDPEYAAFLNRLRLRQCVSIRGAGFRYTDMEYLSTRLLANLSSSKPHVLQDFWDAPIIVGSKALRDVLNVKLIKYHAGRQCSELATYFSFDILDKTLAKGSIQKQLWDLPSSENKEAFGRLPLFVGMKVMVTENLAFDNGIVNGSEGVVTRIKYEEDTFQRRYAKVVYVRIPGCGINIKGLDPDVAPIFPVSTRLLHNVENATSRSFTRKQVPLVPAYVYTDFKAQGRTTDRVIVDIATARGQGVYVMLSRVKTLSGLIVLRWFSPTKIYQRLPEELRDELDRLHKLNELTAAEHRPFRQSTT